MEGDAVSLEPYRRTAYFNPLPPHGGRQLTQHRFASHCVISIHSLRMEGDPKNGTQKEGENAFQSTPSAWRETVNSTHFSGRQKFQSTPSAWRETLRRAIHKRPYGFQSTPSAWRETRHERRYCKCNRFQSTPSAWRETRFVVPHMRQTDHFNPLPPHGGRHTLFL